MKKILSIFLVSIILIGCNQNRSGKRYYNNGQLKEVGDYKTVGNFFDNLLRDFDLREPPTRERKNGLWKEYYENGHVKCEQTYKVRKMKNCREGNYSKGCYLSVKDGLRKFYTEDGQLTMESNWTDGKKDGLWK